MAQFNEEQEERIYSIGKEAAEYFYDKKIKRLWYWVGIVFIVLYGVFVLAYSFYNIGMRNLP